MARKFVSASSQGLLLNSTANNSGPLAIPANHAMAVSIWANFSAFVASGAIINKGYDGSTTAWELQESSTTQIQFDTFSGTNHGAAGTHGFSTGQWNHIYGDYDGSTWHIYFNGVLGGSSVDAVGPVNNAARVDIGCIDITSTPHNFVDASLADAAVWNVALSALEIAALAKGARPYTVRPLSLKGYWPIDGLQSLEPDLSGFGNNATLSNAPTLAAGPPLMLFTPRWPTQFVPPPPPPVFNLMPQIVM